MRDHIPDDTDNTIQGMDCFVPHNDRKKIRLFPEVMLEADSLDFSFSGIKTAVKREIDHEMIRVGFLSEIFTQYIAYEFEETVTDILTKKLLRAVDHTGVENMLLAG